MIVSIFISGAQRKNIFLHYEYGKLANQSNGMLLFQHSWIHRVLLVLPSLHTTLLLKDTAISSYNIIAKRYLVNSCR